MRIEFLTRLRVEKLAGDYWRTLEPFSVRIHFEAGDVCPNPLLDLMGSPLIVPAGYTTDFASVPRLPIAFLLAGDTAHEAAVPHDYLCDLARKSKNAAVRAFGDRVFLAAMVAKGVPWWRRRMMYAAVRAWSLVAP